MLLSNAPFYGSAPSGVAFYTAFFASSPLVPYTFPVAIGGRAYEVDWNQPFYRQYHRQLAQLIRTQADTSSEPGEQTMDPNSLWRRSFEDWSLGAGQRYLDRPAVTGEPSYTGSVPNAFWQSKGIDAITDRWAISLLPDTISNVVSANTNITVITAGQYIYWIDGQTLQWSLTPLGLNHVVTGTPAVNASSICTDGYNIWVAYGADGIYTTTVGSTSATQYVTSAVDTAAIVGYCNARLMLASTNIIYNIIGAGALPAPLFTSGNPNMTYCGFAEGNGAIYAGASAGARSWIYGMTVTTDGLTLGAPVIQGAFPPGENVTAVYGELGFLFTGTTLGVRMNQTASDGAVTLGSLIVTPAPVECLTGFGEFIYFGWSQFDTVSSGIGKISLLNQVVPGILPAYCSDLMVTTQDPVTSIAVWPASTTEVLFTVAGLGIYGTNPSAAVPSGYIQSGIIEYDLTDPKIACLLDIQRFDPPDGGGTMAVYLAVDAGAFTPIGVTTFASTALTYTFGCGPVSGQKFEVQIVLTRDIFTAKGPVVSRWTLRSYPAPARPLTWQVPIILSEEIINRSSGSQGMDPYEELTILEGFATNGTMVNFQEGLFTYPVFVQDIEFLPDYTTSQGQSLNPWFNGIALITLVGLPNY